MEISDIAASPDGRSATRSERRRGLIAVDTNILVYSHRTEGHWHKSASECVRSLAEGTEPWAILWPSLYGFLVTVTNPLVFKTPTPYDRAVAQVDAWLESPSLVVLTEGRGGRVYWAELSHQLLASRATGQAVNHARVAALCLHHGVTELWSAHRDYSAFPGLKIRNPLIPH